MANKNSIYSSHTLLPHQLFPDSATQYFCWLPREHTTIGARASKEVDRVGHTNRLQHPGARRQHWAAAPILIVNEALSLAAFLVDKVWRSHSSYGIRRRTVKIASNCAWPWRVVVSMRSSKESESRFFSVEAVALPNLPQTFRGRERSKSGYAADLLV